MLTPAMSALPATYRLLLVDDAPTVREALRWALEDAADLAVVGEAGDGIEAIERARELAPDAVVLDIELPWLDGYAVARALKSLPGPPVVIFLSVHGDSASIRRAAESGGDGFVQKGSGLVALIDELRRLLGGRRPADDI
jgi:DNA-binding NarL/FixJ family response regulator